MKKLLMILIVLLASTTTTFAQSVKNYYYLNGGAICSLSFYRDKDNDDCVDVWNGYAYIKYRYNGKSNRGNYRYRSFTFAPEQKMVTTFYSPFPVPQYTGKIIKSDTDNYLFVSPDYSTVIANGMSYTRTTKERYEKIANAVAPASTPNYNYGGTSSGGTIKNDSYDKPTNKHGSVACKSCNGSGRCNYCNGMGYFRNYDDTKTQCATCQGRGKCGVCYGTGKIRY